MKAMRGRRRELLPQNDQDEPEQILSSEEAPAPHDSDNHNRNGHAYAGSSSDGLVQVANGSRDENDGCSSGSNSPEDTMEYRWSPSGIWCRDMLHFVGPGFMVCIAYVDPGNYQADIQAGATARYQLLWTVWWSSILSIYVQVLCVRLAIYGQVTLAEVQAADNSDRMRWLNWLIAEFSIVITDLPEVIGVGIACNVFFGWPYYVGVLLSLCTTMIFLAFERFGIRVLEAMIVVFVGIMSIALFAEMNLVGYNLPELMEGWAYGFIHVTAEDIFSITGVLGAVVMPHNLYLHTAACQSRRVVREESIVKQAVWLSSLEPMFPILVSFFINLAIVSIAAESVYGEPDAANVGLTDFCNYFQYLKSGCVLWGIALLAAGQSSAITTTYTGQFVMEGFLEIRMPTWARAVLTRLVAITPCVVVSAAFPDDMNLLVNIVNSALSLLLPFAFTPLVKYTTSEEYMGKYAPPVWERWLLRGLAFAVYLLNAIAISAPGGGFFGFIFEQKMSARNATWFVYMVVLQVFYLWWNATTAFTPVKNKMIPLEQERVYEDGKFAKADPIKGSKKALRSLELTEQEELHLDPVLGNACSNHETDFSTSGTMT